VDSVTPTFLSSLEVVEALAGFRQLPTATIHTTTATHISIVQIKINKPDRPQVSYDSMENGKLKV
jgi:hypothetical protein